MAQKENKHSVYISDKTVLDQIELVGTSAEYSELKAGEGVKPITNDVGVVSVYSNDGVVVSRPYEEKIIQWTCPVCGFKNNTGAECSHCGRPVKG